MHDHVVNYLALGVKLIKLFSELITVHINLNVLYSHAIIISNMSFRQVQDILTLSRLLKIPICPDIIFVISDLKKKTNYTAHY